MLECWSDFNWCPDGTYANYVKVAVVVYLTHTITYCDGFQASCGRVICRVQGSAEACLQMAGQLFA